MVSSRGHIVTSRPVCDVIHIYWWSWHGRKSVSVDNCFCIDVDDTTQLLSAVAVTRSDPGLTSQWPRPDIHWPRYTTSGPQRVAGERDFVYDVNAAQKQQSTVNSSSRDYWYRPILLSRYFNHYTMSKKNAGLLSHFQVAPCICSKFKTTLYWRLSVIIY